MRGRRLNWSGMWIVLASVTGNVACAGINPDDPPSGRFSDEWAEVFLAGEKVGYFHASMTRLDEVIHSQTVTFMRVGRADQPVSITVTDQATERIDGTPLSFEVVQEFSVTRLTMRGLFKEGGVELTTSQFGLERTEKYPLPDGLRLKSWGSFREGLIRGLAPGTNFTLNLYEPGLRLDGPVEAVTQIDVWEEFSARGTKKRGLRVESTLRSPIGSLDSTSWVDENGMPLRATFPVPGLGNIEVIACDQKTALADFMPPELFRSTVVSLDRPLDVARAGRIRYGLRVKNRDAAIGDLPRTPMQSVHPSVDGTTEVDVSRLSYRRAESGEGSPTPSREPSPPSGNDTAVVPGEFLGSNLMMNLNDQQLVELGRRAADHQEDPFLLADRLRRFVTDYVATKNLNIGFATANEVVRTREGDCTEHGVLLAALGRVNGLPSRVVVGLAYVDEFSGRRHVLGFHLWTQFLIDGRWFDYDAALGESECSPGRIAFAVSSLHQGGIADLTLPLLSLIGSIDVRVLDVEPIGQPSPQTP